MNGKDVIPIYNGIYNGTYIHSAIKEKNEIMPFAATWMDLEVIISVK